MARRGVAGRQRLWLLAPALAGLLVLVGYPLFETVRLSLTDTEMVGSGGGSFVGLQNYAQALASPDFWQALRVTVVFTVLTISVELAIGLLTALLLDQKLHGRVFVRALLIIPWALPTVINAMTWRVLYNPEFGALNAALSQLGLIASYQSWLGDPDVALYAIAVADIWKTFPLVALVILAALQSVPRELHEAASIDGAGAFMRFAVVTWPAILGAVSIVAVLRVIEVVKVFDIIYVMTRGGPLNSTRSLAILVYQQAFSFHHSGYGAALALLSVGLSVALIVIYLLGLRRQARAA
jgi:multiple sugar transport system permease protein